MDSALIDKTARLLLESRHGIALTGAGISTESGVPDFRSPGGIWEKYDPSIFFYDRFKKNPEAVWKALMEMNTSGGLRLWDAKPNKGHDALSFLENEGYLKAVITQNVDNLHQSAGSINVVEFHGNMIHAICLTCSSRYHYETVLDISKTKFPPRCDCGGILKPDAVFFGEAIPSQALSVSLEHARLCDLMLVVGTSAQVEPAASLPLEAKGISHRFGFRMKNQRKECRIVEINREPTPLTGNVSDYIILGSAGDILDRIAQRVKKIKGN